MSAFYFINYFIYAWYKKRDSAPLSASFFLPLLFLYFNIFSIVYWLSILFNFQPPFTKEYAISFFIALAILSYFILYHKARYKEIFANFEDRKNSMQQYRIYVRIYIASSILLLLATLIHADIRVDGHL
jgi:uncharacterized protein YhhL (DUF1145 family)